MMSWDNLEYFCLLGELYQKRQQGGIQPYRGVGLDHNHIWKNNISLGSDGIYRQLHENGV